MSIRQLFTEKPPKSLIFKMLKAIGFNNLEDKSELSVLDLIDNGTKQLVINMIPELREYYIPCKSDIYLNNLTEKRCIAICRQLLRTIDYTFITREKYIITRKYTMYKLISKDRKKTNEILKGNGTLVVKFN
jgi:hypothetical protein